MRRKFNRTVPLNSRCYFIPILFNLTEVVSVISVMSVGRQPNSYGCGVKNEMGGSSAERSGW